MAINGNNILIYVGGSLVAGTRSNEIQVNREVMEIASPSSGDFREYFSGRKDWSLNISWLVPNATNIQQLLLSAGTVTVRIVGRGESLGLTGSAIVTSCKMTFTRGNLAQGSLQLRGSGALTQETVSPIRP